MYDDYDYSADFSDLLGKTLVEIKNQDNDRLTFRTDQGEVYYQFHQQDCCESVTITSIDGDLDDLIGSPILLAEEASNSDSDPSECESSTWTFYKLATISGSVTIRWLDTSNGYYSESVDFCKEKKCG